MAIEIYKGKALIDISKKHWIIYDLALDIVAQGDTLKVAIDAFERTIVGEIILNNLDKIPAALPEYSSRYDEGLPLDYGRERVHDVAGRKITIDRAYRIAPDV